LPNRCAPRLPRTPFAPASPDRPSCPIESRGYKGTPVHLVRPPRRPNPLFHGELAVTPVFSLAAAVADSLQPPSHPLNRCQEHPKVIAQLTGPAAPLASHRSHRAVPLRHQSSPLGEPPRRRRPILLSWLRRIPQVFLVVQDHRSSLPVFLTGRRRRAASKCW
jgi:hypothetical protein